MDMGKLADDIRKTIRDSGMSRYAISRLSGVPESVFSRFMNGECSITLTTLEKLAPVLGLRITTTTKKRPSDSGHRTKTVKKAR